MHEDLVLISRTRPKSAVATHICSLSTEDMEMRGSWRIPGQPIQPVPVRDIDSNIRWRRTEDGISHQPLSSTCTHKESQACIHIHMHTPYTQKQGKQRNLQLLWENKMTTITAQAAGRDSFHGEGFVEAHGFSPQSAHSLEPAAKQKHWSGRAWWRKPAHSRWPGNRLTD